MWGPTIGPWMVLASIALLTLGWYGHGRVVNREWNWRIPGILKIDLVSGRSPILEIREERKGNWVQRVVKRILEEI
jgi:hypothetical protein